MKIVCDSCGAKYSIADEKVAGKIFKIRCKKCSSVLEVRGDQTGAHPFESTASSPDQGADAAWYIVVDGEQRGPLPPIQLSQLFAKGSVGLDSYVWKEGFDDWKVAGDVPELAQVFGGAVAQGKSSGASVDDTSSFGTGRDLFGDGGREPTSEIDTGGSMFGSFDENPTPTDSQNSPIVAGTDQAGMAAALGGVGAGIGGGAMGASGPQRMTGQRNENSVLFSLSNLQQLASGGGAPASRAQTSSSTSKSSPQTTGEGSGLIDIRALAKSTTPGTHAAPSQSVDDLLAIGASGAGGALGAPLLGPTPLETSDGNRWLWIGGAAIAVIAIVGAGIGVGMALGGGEDDALEITATAPQQPDKPPAQPTEAVVVAQAATDPSSEQALEDEEPAEVAEAATIEEPEARDSSPEPETRRPEPRERRTASTSRRQRPTRATDDDRRAPTPTKRSGNNLDALMDEVVGGSPTKSTAKQASSQRSSDSSLPDSPSRDDVKTALQGVSGAVQACRKDDGGTATVDVVFSGKTGRATSARVASGPFKGTPVGSCIESAVKRARLPRFQQSSFKVTFPYRL